MARIALASAVAQESFASVRACGVCVCVTVSVCLCVCARARRDWRAANHHDHDTLLAGIVNCPRITILYAFLPQWSTMAANRAISCEQRSLAIPHWHPGRRGTCFITVHCKAVRLGKRSKQNKLTHTDKHQARAHAQTRTHTSTQIGTQTHFAAIPTPPETY